VKDAAALSSATLLRLSWRRSMPWTSSDHQGRSHIVLDGVPSAVICGGSEEWRVKTARRGSRGRQVMVASWSTRAHVDLLVRGKDASSGRGGKEAAGRPAGPERRDWSGSGRSRNED
jgi:hypothetical protein